MTKSNIISLEPGDSFTGVVKVLNKRKPGPVVFTLSDGYGVIDGVIRDSEYDTNDVVRVNGRVEERAGSLQIEINEIKESDTDFNEIIREAAEPERTEFSIESERYEKMKSKFIQVSKRVRRAVLENQPIIIRYHNDSDGINASIAIEEATKLLMKKTGIDSSYKIFRKPSRTPFYSKKDMFRDVINAERMTESHDQKEPLILIIDTGSSSENVFSVKMLKNLGYEVVVIDHHNPGELKNGKTRVCEHVSIHLNPYLFGLDSETCAGMMCYEIARFVSEEFENPLIPAIAGITDYCKIREVEEYIKKTGKSREELEKIGTAIDYTAYHLRHNPGAGVYEKYYTNEIIVEDINEEVNTSLEEQVKSIMPYVDDFEINNVVVSQINLRKYKKRYSYPNAGKIVGRVHELTNEEYEKPIITLGYLKDMVIIRATKPIIPLPELMKRLQAKIPHANIDGGGHEVAGTIKFIPAHRDNILEEIRREFKKETN